MINDEKLYSFVPYGRQTITEADIRAVVDVLRSPYLTQGPVVPSFEQAVAQKVCATYGVAVNSATSALHIACLSLGLESGDWLWTSPISFVASANCGLYCGASVDFVDIDESSGLMSLTALEEKLIWASANGKLPKLVVPVHLAGASCDMKSIYTLAQKYGFYILEDASHAVGGSYGSKPVGCCAYSDITVFSFHPVKIITTAEGGMAVTNSAILAEKMTNLRSHGITKDKANFVMGNYQPWVYEQQDLGFNYRLTDVQAALGLSQLERLDAIINSRNKLLVNYEGLINRTNIPIQILQIPPNVKSSVHLAIILLDKGFSHVYGKLFNFLRSRNVGVQLHYMPIHMQPFYQNMGFSIGDFPHAESYSQRALSLPLFPGLELSQQRTIVQLIFEFFQIQS